MNTMAIINSVLPGMAGSQSLHPMLVHFPIALIPAALALQMLGWVNRRLDWAAHARVGLYLGTVGALAAVGAGFAAADALGHDTPGHDLVHVHRNFMVVTTLLAVGTCVLARGLASRPATRDRAVTLGLVVTTAVLILGADRGANLVYRYGMGVARQPGVTQEDSHGTRLAPGESRAHAKTDHAADSGPKHGDH